ncbi:helix-turn-helix domain-containing protein [Clostridium brassicae]|uniref:Helix-turn-helix transcriptional regulator n=1 Tax=Clostridium brassicae TaxID=2999072 RepID=A0ABT4D7M9_9CLOT|nr:helix-turn-helix transcriptional regulator [Clostridium brassicae]MCY6958301.1 helix-turn-helix transcriptional regulator [Clostridium brassicae]
MIVFKLDELLKSKGKTKYWLSKETGTDNNTLGKIYNNESKQIKLQTLEKICNALECDISDILEIVKED